MKIQKNGEVNFRRERRRKEKMERMNKEGERKIKEEGKNITFYIIYVTIVLFLW